MQKPYYITALLLFAQMAMGCAQNTTPCKEGINLLPMYGHVAKCEEQLAADKDFFAECEKLFPNRASAAKKYVEKGWDFYYAQDYNSAMKRFNQAWLLDSLNADVYWGFGIISGTKHQYKESLQMFEQSIKLNAGNPRVYQCMATSYAELFQETKDVALLNQSIDNIKKALSFEPENPQLLAALTGSYSYFNQTDSARKYLALTDKIDSTAVSPEVREILNSKSR